MLIGGLIGASIGFIILLIGLVASSYDVSRYNNNPINQALRRKATMQFNPVSVIIPITTTLWGLIIGYFL